MDSYSPVCDITTQRIASLLQKYAFLEYSAAGKTILGRDIPLIRIGEGKKNILFVGGADATDGTSESVLLQFAEDLCRHIALGKTAYRINCPYLFENRSIWILPRINPDGRALVTHGADPTCPLYEQQLRQNNMKNDFSSWHGNARGVLPTLNFSNSFANHKGKPPTEYGGKPISCGEFPESEPESATVAFLIRTLSPCYLIELGIGNKQIFCVDPHDKHYLDSAAHMTGFTVSETSAPGVSMWFSQVYQRPSLFFACPPQSNSPFALSVYNALKEFLFCSPILIGT